MRLMIAVAIVALAACSAPERTDAQTGSGSEARSPINAPAWIRVVGVAEGDVLNIRARPDASSEIVGTFIPNQGRIEVVETRSVDGQHWGLVSTGEQGGWINLAYAEATEMAMIGESPVPAGTVCAGTEPFWSLDLGDDEAVWSSFDAEDETFTITESEAASGRFLPWMFGLQGFGLAIVTPGQCSDGMSDIPYAWTVSVIGHDETGHVLYQGCCRLQTDR
ncbi:SH3 domain-containing protein [Hyphobacterium sp. SN044]|uniref:COG3650 family protein n=1 Tax=Hyphobacterium sp. SN044 TaxID=2912575 RepID=UPI001F38047B|nr:SH3 domain-containing protein [Hyphobacterium sp. SN044]MCF8878680.1 SH3 domain-containing protein [Hyphobacterium sp. SN044]